MPDANFPRDRVREQCVRDPGITIGRFKVLERTDRKFIVYDPLANIAHGTAAGPFDKIGEAVTAAERCALQRPGAFIE